jgi:hypothetical protein
MTDGYNESTRARLARKTSRLMVRFSPEERAALDAMAEDLGLSTATFVRSLVIQHMKKAEKKDA